jgi:hypothetical protein
MSDEGLSDTCDASYAWSAVFIVANVLGEVHGQV